MEREEVERHGGELVILDSFRITRPPNIIGGLRETL